MATLQTLFRATVMLATLGLLAKAWYHYGPTVDELQVMGARVVQVAQETWSDYWQQPSAVTPLAGDTPPSPFEPPSVEPPPISTAPSLAMGGPVQLAGGVQPFAPGGWGGAPSAETGSPGAVVAPALVPMEAPLRPTGDRVGEVVAQLEALGIRDHELRQWGSAGELHRFSGSAPLANSPSFRRHFEAVAETPEAAVERVAADIDAWYRARK